MRLPALILAVGLAWITAGHGGTAMAGDAATLQKIYDGAMRPDEEVGIFSHSERLFPVRVAHKGAAIRPLLPWGRPFPAVRFLSQGHAHDLYDYLAVNRVAGLLVLKDGRVALEDYELGIGPQTRWASFSIAKSISSTLVGAAIKDGLIGGLDDPVARYVPALRQGAYEGVSIRQIIQMASGVAWSETYTDPHSDRRRLLAAQMEFRPGRTLATMAALGRAAPAGSVWNYNTGETYVLGAVVEGATHRSLADYLSDKIWSRVGMEQDATWWVESEGGMGLGGSGLAATLRDYGRFGLIAANEGQVAGDTLVPAGWFKEAGRPHAIGGAMLDYGYLWWIPDQTNPTHFGAFQGEGIFGQFLYVNPRAHVVIVVLSARSKPRGAGTELDDEAFFAAVVQALN